MMGDLGHDMESNVFTLMELRYRGGRMDGWNTKGILKAAPDMTVERPKQAYYAVQSVTAIFDSTLGRIRDFACRSDLDQPLAAYAYKRADGACAATLWLSGKVPADANDKTPANLTLTGVKFTEPVWVDLRTGEVRAIPANSWKAGSDGCTFRAMPLYDSPVVIAEKSLVPLAPAAPPAADATSVPQSAPPAARAAGPECVLSGLVRIAGPRQDDAIRLAMEDLARDFQAALGAKAEVRPPPEAGKGPPADIVVRLDGDLKEPESYAIDVAARGVTIRGADRLGAVYGVYRFGREFLGVDPLWFWKGRAAPADRRDRIVLPPGTVRSRRPTFRYRGWFINDEDLLTEWLPPSGKRSIDYPFYAQVISLEIAERIFEALLRCEGNLVIPASFVDVMNEPEAELVRRAVRRGLYVTQHHIEPLGVSHFGFESFWKRRGRTVRMSYASDPQASRETWTAFAERWGHLGGEQVIWQLGLRGRGDMPVWSSDKSVSADKAGEIISAAIADQWRIVRSVDKRDQPPATVTLWMEGSQLMARGSLKLPRGVTVVFADEGSSQTLQDDFRQTPRAADHTYGLYYHIAFWSRGPHLVAGTRIGKLADQLGQAVDKGDTHYAVFNVSNIREHVLGAAAGMEILRDGRSWDRKGFVGRWPARQVALPECLLELPGERLLQDGTAWVLARKLLDQLASKKTAFPKEYLPAGTATAGDFAAALDRCIQKLDALVKQADAGAADRFYTHTQPLMLRQYYACLRELALALEDRSRLAAACKELEALLAIRSEAQAGRWVNWYRGDKKENLPALLERTRALTTEH